MKFNDRLLQGYSLEKKIASLHGHARLDLLRDNKVVHRVEHDNTITPWIANAIGAGNFHDQILPSKIMPIKQWFEGCLLTDKENDPASSMIAGDANVVAQASNDAYSGDNTKRGSVNNNESGIITDGYRFVWDWATSQGNGVIASVCLTRANIGAFCPDTSIDETVYALEMISNEAQWSNLSEAFRNCQIIDYEKERAYYVAFSKNTLTITEYVINTRRLHITGSAWDVTALVATHEIATNVVGTRLSASYTGDAIHFITYQNATINDYCVDTDNWTYELTTNTYSLGTGISFLEQANTGSVGKDIAPIIDGYIFAMTTNMKMAKCSLSNPADVTLLDIPSTTFANSADNGPTVILPNGDWIKHNSTTGTQNSSKGFYYHNGAIKHVQVSPRWRPVGLNGNMYGTMLWKGYDATSFLATTYPYVSTVNNLDSAVTKSADLTMKLTYEITEVNE